MNRVWVNDQEELPNQAYKFFHDLYTRDDEAFRGPNMTSNFPQI